MIKIVDNNFYKKKWNEMAKHPLQSWEWGEARKQMGIEIIRIYEDINIFQLTLHPIPYTKFKIGYLPRSVFPTDEVLKFLYNYGKNNKVIFFKIEPHVILNSSRLAGQVRHDKLLIKSKHPLFPDWTQIIDLTKSEEELLKQMKPKTRYNIRLAEKKGVIVKEESNDQGFKIFSKLYFDTCKRQKYFGHTPQYHQIVWKNLKNNIAHILVAYYQDTPLVAYELFHFKDMLYYPYGGSSENFRNLMAANLIMWETIKLGKKLGAKKLDMWGSLPPDYNQKHDWAGFTRFKEGYGGELVQMIASFDLIINPFLYKIYNSIYSLREIYLKLRSLL